MCCPSFCKHTNSRRCVRFGRAGRLKPPPPNKLGGGLPPWDTRPLPVQGKALPPSLHGGVGWEGLRKMSAEHAKPRLFPLWLSRQGRAMEALSRCLAPKKIGWAGTGEVALQGSSCPSPSPRFKVYAPEQQQETRFFNRRHEVQTSCLGHLLLNMVASFSGLSSCFT